MAQGTGVAAAMKYFGKRPGETLVNFKDEWNKLSEKDQEQLRDGIANGSFTY